tara:strand:- start:1224 stop:1625 length:402 start_codon:yes stop_codon:yes gene_type:complete
MKTREQIKSELEQHNADYKAGKLNVSYSRYLKKYKRLASAYKSYYSVSNRIKRYGAKVTKTSSGYTFTGKRFTAYIFLDGCVTDFWNYQCEDAPRWLTQYLDEMELHLQKSDLLNTLLIADEQFDTIKAESED